MDKKVKIALALALVVCLLGAAVVIAATTGPQITWDVVAGGGGVSSSGNVQVMDTIGQPVVGDSSGGNATLNAGFWQILAVKYGIFLPIISR